MVPAWRQGREKVMLAKGVAHSPAETRRNHLAVMLWEARKMQEPGGCSVLGWLMLWISLCFLDIPIQDCGSDTPPYLVPCLNQDLDWLTGLLTEVEMRYMHFINL